MRTSAWAFGLRRLRRGASSGELRVLALAVTIAVAAMSSVSLFFGSLRLAIERQTADTLGADLVFSSRDPLPDDLVPASLRSSDAVVFASVVVHGERTALASAKAVGADYPLRGAVRISDVPFGTVRLASGIPPPGEAWADLRLWQELGLCHPGEPRCARDDRTIQFGGMSLHIAAVIVDEPGRGTGFTDLAPRLLVNALDVAGSPLIGPGARAQYLRLVAGEPSALEPLRARALPRGVKLLSPQEARPQLVGAIEESGDFLAIARLAATLLAASAIALSAWHWGRKLRDEVALLKCLGADSTWVVDAYTVTLLALGMLSAVVGAVAGYGASAALAALLGSLLSFPLPDPPLLAPLGRAATLALLLLLGFALPPIQQAATTAPVRIFQRGDAARSSRLPVVAAVAAVAAIFWLQIGDWLASAIVLGGLAFVGGILAALGFGAVRLLGPLRQAVGTSWRFGLGNVARRQGTTVAQIVALGFALLALLLVTVVRQDLLESWRRKLPPDTPNQFLINVQQDQIVALQEFMRMRGVAPPQFWPMARARLVKLRGEPVTADTFTDPETQRWINRDFNLSWTDTLGEDNELRQGEWWGPEGRGQPLLSVDEYAVQRLDLKLGDTLTLDFAGSEIELTVASTRKVHWDSFRPNFFLLAPPGVLEGRAPTQWLSSVHLEPGQRALLPALIATFPNVTVLDLVTLMAQVRAVMEQILRAVEFVFGFTLAAGLTVLLAAIEATRSERIRETGVLRALGARAGTVMRGLLAEYAALGLLAGTVAAIAAQLAAWALAVFVFKMPYGPRPLVWFVGAGSGMLLVAGLGCLSLRGTLKTPPHAVLRQGA